MTSRNPSFRNGFYAGLLVAAGLGIYLFQLWDSGNQVRLHSAHLITALQEKNWPAVEEFIDPSYADQWGHDRATVATRLRQVLSYARNLRVAAREIIVRTANGEGVWRARVTIEADPNEVTALIKERVNALEEPFELVWRHGSRKPWDWKLVRVTNASLELPSGSGF
jgi:hypothetical protein